MYVIEHSLLNLVKNKGRNILLGTIILAIITATVVALAIYNTTGIVMEETRAALQSAVRIAPQTQAAGGGQRIVSGAQAQTQLSMEQYQHFAESSYLHGSDIRELSRGVEATFYLIRPEMLADFEAEMRIKGLPDDYAVRTDESAFGQVAEPVESLQSLSIAFLIIILALGAIIMTLLSAIVIRERKYEIGVLRAMGMKKNKVALGIWTEIIVITCICFALGMAAGAALAQPVSDAIMSGQAGASAAGSTTLADRLNEVIVTEPETIGIMISGVTALQIFAVSILLASIAGMLSVTRITKYEPMKIMHNS